MIDIYFGLRTSSSTLHFGHFIYLLDLYKYIQTNFNKIDNIYLLFAQMHSLINTNLTINDIMKYTDSLLKNITLIFTTFDIYFKTLNEITTTIYPIFQFNYSQYLYELLYLLNTKIKTNYLLKNPIYLNNNNQTIGLLIYPILQALDVFLFANRDKIMLVCVSNDQKANLNMMKDLNNKFKFNYNIDFHINNNVLYDSNNKNKMSKSLNNIVNLNINEIRYYIMKYVNYPRLKNEIGYSNKCPLFNNLLQPILSNLNKLNLLNEISSMCNNGKILCKDCKNRLIYELEILFNIYNNIKQYKKLPTKLFSDLTKNNYLYMKQQLFS